MSREISMKADRAVNKAFICSVVTRSMTHAIEVRGFRQSEGSTNAQLAELNRAQVASQRSGGEVGHHACTHLSHRHDHSAHRQMVIGSMDSMDSAELLNERRLDERLWSLLGERLSLAILQISHWIGKIREVSCASRTSMEDGFRCRLTKFGSDDSGPPDRFLRHTR